MPRTSRRISNSGIYHAIIRTNEQYVFKNQKNCIKLLKVLKDIKMTNAAQIYAYCIMPDHVHILLKSCGDLSAVFKRIAVMYVRWYNGEYNRRGTLFCDRFMSEPIETDADFLNVIAFIHQNPVTAGLCVDPAEYRFSSYNEYFKKSSSVVDTARVFALTDPSGFEAAHGNGMNYLEIPKRAYVKKTDEEGNKLITEFVQKKLVEKFEYMTLINQHRCIIMLKEKGFSIRQIHRLTNVPVSTIRKL